MTCNTLRPILPLRPAARAVFISALALGLLSACQKPAELGAAMPPAATGSDQVADVDVTTNVKTALLRDPALQGLDISVATLKGDVRLTGFVDTQAQLDQAIQVARAASGAHTVHDELSIKK